jgi:hypothetical protein
LARRVVRTVWARVHSYAALMHSYALRSYSHTLRSHTHTHSYTLIHTHTHSYTLIREQQQRREEDHARQQKERAKGWEVDDDLHDEPGEKELSKELNLHDMLAQRGGYRQVLYSLYTVLAIHCAAVLAATLCCCTRYTLGCCTRYSLYCTRYALCCNHYTLYWGHRLVHHTPHTFRARRSM